MLLLLNTLLAAVSGYLLLRISGPKTWSDRIAQFILLSFAIVIFVSEAAGRIAYIPKAMTAGLTLVLACTVVLYWLVGPKNGGTDRERIDVRQLVKPHFWFDPSGIALGVMAVAWLLVMLDAVYGAITIPPFLADAMRYHLAGPAAWIAEQKIAVIPGADYRVNHFPHAGSLLFGWPMLHLRNDVLVTIPNVVVAALLAPSVIASGAQRLGADWRIAWIIGVAAATASPILLAARVEWVDALFWLAATYSILLALDSFRDGWRTDFAVGAAMGIALGTKTFGFVFFPIAGLAWILGQTRFASVSYLWTWEFLRRGICVAGVAVLVGSWVYADNLRTYGNPVYPYNLSLGPIKVQGAAADELFLGKAVLDGTKTKLQNLFAVVGSYPALFTGQEPFDDSRSNFGPGFPILLLAIAALAVVRVNRTSFKAADRDEQLISWGVLMVIPILMTLNLILAAHWGAQFIHKKQPDYGSAARYQAVIPILVAWLIAALLVYSSKKSRLAVIFVCLVTAGMNIWSSPRLFPKRSALAFEQSDATFEPQRLNMVSRIVPFAPPQAYWRTVAPTERVLVNGAGGLHYHYYKPGFNRYVTIGLGANLLFEYGFDRILYSALTSFRRPETTPFDGCGSEEELLRAYFDRLVVTERIDVVVNVEGPRFQQFFPGMTEGVGWTQIFDETHRRFRFQGYRRNRDFEDTSAPIIACIKFRHQ